MRRDESLAPALSMLLGAFTLLVGTPANWSINRFVACAAFFIGLIFMLFGHCATAP